ncbi:TonB-dependent receptor domain-containing protein [Oleiharenicola lentus]|uniref:TonB-dependent receptor domain-containing protein n=1 Tax=Oleiharenicola lentus TaxID=2508720 RepID=UPI003F666BD3
MAVSSLSAQTGRIEGTVTSRATSNALQGARVTLADSSQFVLTDSSGRFVLFNVPAGSAQITASYSGFEDLTQSVQVTSGAQAEASFILASSDTLQLEKFTVNSVKEGQALAVTEQRNASNVKNVVAMDEWGVLPTQNVAELLTRMPGVTASVDEDNLMNYVSIRGQPNTFTTLNIDGMSSTGVSAFGRAPSFHSFSASTIEQIELILGQTPDRRADSLGGTVNLKTRSPLAMSGKRRIDYTLAGSWAASWGDRNVPLKDHPFGPDLSVTYTEVFDVLGGKRNLGITATASYQEIVRSFDFDRMLYENTTNSLAQLRDYTRVSGLNQRFLEAFSMRADYRWRDHTTVSARFLYNAGDEPNFNYTWVNPFFGTNTTVYDPVTNPTGAVMPGYTTNRTEVRPSGNTQMLLTPQHYAFTSRNPTGTLVAEHKFGRLKIEEAIRWSNTIWNSTAGRDQEGGILTLRTAPLGSIGFILDTTDLTGQVFTQTAGPSVYSAANYASILSAAANTTTQPVAQTSTSLVKRDTENRTNEVSAYVNLSYTFGTKFPLTLKTGFDTQNKRVNLFNKNPQRYYAVVGTVLSGELMPLTEFERQNAPAGSRLPVFNPDKIDVTNTAVWYEDTNYTAVQRYTTRRLFEEGVDAAFLMGDTKLGRLRVVGGVRSEWVKTETFTYFRARSTPIAVEPDHFKRAAMDFQAQSADGVYDKLFPSIQFAYDISRNLVARASWSTSYGRPTYQQLIPAVTVNDTTQTVTIGNASIKPQFAKNIDLKLEYYFKNTGAFTVSVYQKDISDLIGGNVNSGETVPLTPDNGFDGLYGGYAILRPSNIGSAEVQGIEFDYRQRLTFLPGALKGLSVRANYAKLKAKGVYNGATELTTDQVAGFVPENANFGLQYAYKKLGLSYDLSYRSGYPSAISLTSPGNGNLFYRALVTHNVGVEYRLRPNVTLFTTANNFTGNGPEIYTYLSNRPRQLLIAPTFVKFGVRGQF